MDSDYMSLRTDLKATQRKLNLLCSWIQLKFGKDPTLPHSLFKYADDQVENQVPLKTEFSDGSPSSEIRIVNWIAIVTPQQPDPSELVQSVRTDCQICGKVYLTSSLLKLHETEHCYVKVQRLLPTTQGQSSWRKDSLPLKGLAKTDQGINGFDSILDLTSHDKEFGPENFSEFDREDDLKASADIDVPWTGDKDIEQIKSIQCDICEEKFSDSDSLLVHKFNVHIASEPEEMKLPQYRCHVCEKSFLGMFHLRRHLQETHADELERKGVFVQSSETLCPICGSWKKSKRLVRIHIETVHPVEATPELLDSLEPVACEICKKAFGERKYYTQHLRHCHPKTYEEKLASGQVTRRHNTKKMKAKPDLQSSCPICGSWKKSKRLVRIHIETAHPAEATPELLNSFLEAVACEICEKSFGERKHYTQHLRRCHPKTYEEKLACGQVTRRYNMNRKQKSSKKLGSCTLGNSSDTFQCPLCNSKFSTKRKVRGHLRRSHVAEATTEIFQEFQEPKSCSVCKKTFRNGSNYNYHMQWTHPEKYAEKVANGEICPRKNPVFANSEPLNAKQKLRPGSELVKCDECERILCRGSLRAHKLAKHIQRLPNSFICPHCPYSGWRKASFESHMKIHFDERMYKCEKCSLGFKQKPGLEAHMRNVHRPVSKHQCTFCGLLVKRLESLRRHIKEVHENKRSFACHQCEKAFKLRTHLNYHIKTHSNPNGRKRGLNKEREPRQKAPNKTTSKTNPVLLMSSKSKPIDNNAIVNSSHMNISEEYHMSVATGNVSLPIFN